MSPDMIRDGAGKGYLAEVTSDNRLNVSSRSSDRIYYVSRDDELAYSWVSIDATPAAGTYVIYLKNTNQTKNLYIDYINCTGEETLYWKVWKVTGTAAGGDSITAANLNLSSALTAQATSRGNDSVTGLTTDGLISTVRHPAGGEGIIQFEDALILTYGQAIAVECNTGSANPGDVDIRGFFE